MLDADLVVAADGVDSRLRTQLLPSHPGPVHSGSTVLRAVTEHPVAAGTDFELTWGRAPSSATSRSATAGRSGTPSSTRLRMWGIQPPAAMRCRFAGWHDPIPALLDATRPEAVLHHDINESVAPLPTYEVGRVAHLGDAAHAMTPKPRPRRLSGTGGRGRARRRRRR
ncbi:FAD-dependent monooxygenase [Streptomyces sp. NPDC059262]|uniref:FAD-dependent monooxygenase n=1 Tax=Streptomyces sp. NPDC059262 TaxID=3346797 RepID=UPI003697792C